MRSIKRVDIAESGTAAPVFHLADTLNWSCFSARIKNQVIILPTYDVIIDETKVPKGDSVENAITKPNDQWTMLSYQAQLAWCFRRQID